MNTKTPADIAARHLLHVVQKELERMVGAPTPGAVFSCALQSLAEASADANGSTMAAIDGLAAALAVEAYERGQSLDALRAQIDAALQRAWSLNVADELGYQGQA